MDLTHVLYIIAAVAVGVALGAGHDFWRSRRWRIEDRQYRNCHFYESGRDFATRFLADYRKPGVSPSLLREKVQVLLNTVSAKRHYSDPKHYSDRGIREVCEETLRDLDRGGFQQ